MTRRRYAALYLESQLTDYVQCLKEDLARRDRLPAGGHQRRAMENNISFWVAKIAETDSILYEGRYP